MPVPKETYQEVLRSLRTAPEVADALGIARRSVTALAKRRGVGTEIGGVRLFSPYDIERLRDRPRGRPSTVRPTHPPPSRSTAATRQVVPLTDEEMAAARELVWVPASPRRA